jgi:hypothetical protein
MLIVANHPCRHLDLIVVSLFALATLPLTIAASIERRRHHQTPPTTAAIKIYLCLSPLPPPLPLPPPPPPPPALSNASPLSIVH